jgi:hypothetical protein
MGQPAGRKGTVEGVEKQAQQHLFRLGCFSDRLEDKNPAVDMKKCAITLVYQAGSSPKIASDRTLTLFMAACSNWPLCGANNRKSADPEVC